MAALAQTALATLRTDATDPRERGRAAGVALAGRAALCLDAYLPLFAELGHSRDEVRRFGARVLDRTARWHAPLAEELEAFALGAQLELELVAALNGRTELLALAECTTVGRTRRARGSVAGAELGLVRGRAGALRGLVGRGRGRALRHDDRGRDPGQGRASRRAASRWRSTSSTTSATGGVSSAFPVHLVLRRLLGEAASVDDAWALLRETPFSASSCITVLDAGGGGAHFELSPAGVARIEPRDGLLAHSNHFLDATLADGEAEQPSDWMPGSRSPLLRRRAGCWRRARAARHARFRSAGDLPARRAGRAEPRSSAPSSRSRCARRPELRVAAGSLRARVPRLRVGDSGRGDRRAYLGRHGRAERAVEPRSRQPTPRR